MTAPLPDFQKGIDYWTSVDASVDGVLGGFGEGPLPRVEQLGSRLFLLSLLPQLQSFPSPLTTCPRSSLPQSDPPYRYTALDVGAGVGRVTKETLLPLLDDIVTVEPVRHFIERARKDSSSWRHLNEPSGSGSGSKGRGKEHDDGKDAAATSLGNSQGKRVWFVQAPLNDLDPSRPLQGKDAQSLGVFGGNGADGGFGERAGDVFYDVIWCQWCLGHLSTPALVAFLRRAHGCLRHRPDTSSTLSGGEVPVNTRHPSVIVIKENMCEDGPNGEPQEELDDEDSSLTRSNSKWLEIFREAGLTVVKEQVQEGLPAGLFAVKMFALR